MTTQYFKELLILSRTFEEIKKKSKYNKRDLMFVREIKDIKKNLNKIIEGMNKLDEKEKQLFSNSIGIYLKLSEKFFKKIEESKLEDNYAFSSEDKDKIGRNLYCMSNMIKSCIGNIMRSSEFEDVDYEDLVKEGYLEDMKDCIIQSQLLEE